MSKAVKAQVFQTTQIRSPLKGDGSWIRRASEEAKPRKPELPRKPVLSPTTAASPVASPTALADPQTPEAKQTGSATETRPPLLRQSSYVLSTAMKFESVSTPENSPFKKVPLSAKRSGAAPESTTDPTCVTAGNSEQVSLLEQPEKPVEKMTEENKEESVDSPVDQPEPAETSAGAPGTPGPPEQPSAEATGLREEIAAVISELVAEQEIESTEKPAIEPAATEPEKEPVEAEAVVEPAATEPEKEPVEAEAVVEPAATEPEKEPVEAEAVVEPAATEPEKEPVEAEAVVEPAATEPEKEPVDAVVEPAADAAVEQIVETVVEVAMDSPAEAVADTAPVVESPAQDTAVVTEPVLEPSAAPVDMAAAEPTAESTTEAASEPVVESALKPQPELEIDLAAGRVADIDKPEVVQESSANPVVDTELPAETAGVNATAEPEEEPTDIPIDQPNAQPTETTAEATDPAVEPTGDTGAKAIVECRVEPAIEAVLEQVSEPAPEKATEAVVQECEPVPEYSKVAAVEPIAEATVEAQSVERAIELVEALDVEVSTPETTAEPVKPAEESLSVELPVNEQPGSTNTESIPEMIQTPAVDLQSVTTLRETEDGRAICSYCDGTIDGHIKITINHPPAYCHPDCFKCGVCSKFLGDMLTTMFLHGQVIHCESCFVKTL